MTYVEFCTTLAKSHDIPYDQVRKVLDAVPKEMLKLLAEGDEVKIQELGTFYPAEYEARKGPLEFGGQGDGGKRTRIRFRPFDATNWRLTQRSKT